MAAVAVIGGGLIGLTSALLLADDGHDVTIVEREALGGGAAQGNAGFMCPPLVDPLPGPGVLAAALRSLTDPTRAVRIHPRAVPQLAPWLVRFARHCTAAHHGRGREVLAALNAGQAAALDRLQRLGVT